MARSLGRYLWELREKRGISPTDLARKSGLSRSSIYNWETGRSRPRVPELETLLAALDANPAQIEDALQWLGAPRAQKRLREIEPASGFLPHGGDLLRALRIRRGWTQEQAAHTLKVTQPTIARWERADAWPAQDALHRVCYLLNAHPAEIATLLLGPFSLSGRVPGDDRRVTVEVVEAMLDDIQKQLSDPGHYALGDLLYLSLEAKANPLLKQSESARPLLAQILLSHANYLSQRCQPPEAGRLGEHAMELLPLRGERWNALRLRAEMYWTVWKFPMREHSRVLGHWLGHTLDSRSRAWVMSQIAGSIISQGDTDLALSMEQRALSVFDGDEDPIGLRNRRTSYAELLLDIGRAAEAAELLTIYPEMTPPIQLRTKIQLTEAHLLAGNRSRAHDYLMEVQNDHRQLGIAYYQPQIDALVAQL